MSVTNPLKQSAKFEDGIWSTAEFSRDFINEKLADMKKSYSTLMYYAVGVWVTAYARRDLARIIFSSKDMDRDVVYCDTDSVKFLNREKHQDIFLSYNNEMIEKYRNVAERYPDDIEIADFMPADKKGVLHPIGFFEFDGLYTEFVTLGAKKYCYREDGVLHITVAGVSKKGVVALGDDIRRFKKGFIWNYHTSGKSTHFYRERHLVTYKVKDKETDQIVKKTKIEDDTQKPFKFKDIDGNVYKCRSKWALVLMPTTYELGVTAEYESVIKDMLRRERKRHEQ